MLAVTGAGAGGGGGVVVLVARVRRSLIRVPLKQRLRGAVDGEMVQLCEISGQQTP